MIFPEPLPLASSWALSERRERIDSWMPSGDTVGGRWSFDLSTGEMAWDRAIYELFGFPPHEQLSRRSAVDCYVGESRCAMEQLRAHAIAHRRGFTLDVDIAPANGEPVRRIRLSAAPVCVGHRAVALEGVKQLLR